MNKLKSNIYQVPYWLTGIHKLKQFISKFESNNVFQRSWLGRKGIPKSKKLFISAYLSKQLDATSVFQHGHYKTNTAYFPKDVCIASPLGELHRAITRVIFAARARHHPMSYLILRPRFCWGGGVKSLPSHWLSGRPLHWCITSIPWRCYAMFQPAYELDHHTAGSHRFRQFLWPSPFHKSSPLLTVIAFDTVYN